MDEVVSNLKSLSAQVYQAHLRESGEDELADHLEEFENAATDMRKAFKRATGTGLGAKVRGLFKKQNDGKEEAATDLLTRAGDLEQTGSAIDRMIESNPPGSATQALWKEIRSNRVRLKSFF